MKILSRVISAVLSLCTCTSLFASMQEARRYIDDEYVPTQLTCERPEHLPTVFALNPQFYPALPESYRWQMVDNKPVLYKHMDAKDHTVEVVIYGPNEKGQVNFLSLVDGVNIQSFSHSPARNFQDSKLRNKYPASSEGFICEANQQSYIRGHCIDFSSTIGRQTDKGLSATDPRNFIPEPERYWGLTIRNALVHDIHNQGGAYIQYPYYAEISPKTKAGYAIPEGVYFVRLGASYQQEKFYQVPWNHGIHSSSVAQGRWYEQIENVKLNQPFYPAPFIYDSGWPSDQLQLYIAPEYYAPAIPHIKVAGEINQVSKHYLTRAAANEFSICEGKVYLSLLKLNTSQDPRTIRLWNRRAIKHAEFLDNLFESSKLSMPEATYDVFSKALRTHPNADQEGAFEDHWHQLWGNQTEGRIRLSTLFEEPHDYDEELPSLPPEAVPEVCINLSSLSGEESYQKSLSPTKSAAKSILKLENVSTKKAGEFGGAIKKSHLRPRSLEITYTRSNSCWKKENIEKGLSQDPAVASVTCLD